MPSGSAAEENDMGKVESTPIEDPAVFIRTGKRYALGYFVVACCFGAGAVFVSGVLRVVLLILAVLFVIIAAWCGFFYELLGGAFKVGEQSGKRDRNVDSLDPEISADRQREMMQSMFPRPTPSLKERVRGRRMEKEPVASPVNRAEALEWARSHQVGVPTGRPWKQRVDLRLTPESLANIAALMGSTDQELVMTASLALAYNGARLDSDVTPTTDPTVYWVTTPNGEVHTIPVESH